MFFFQLQGRLCSYPRSARERKNEDVAAFMINFYFKLLTAPRILFPFILFSRHYYRQLFEISSLHFFSIANDLMFFLVAESSTAGGAVTNNMIAIICADLLMPYFQGLGRKSLPFGVRPSIIFRGTPVAGPVVRNYD